MTDDIVGGVSGGGRSERATGTPNTIYDLSSVLFHALEGGASYDTYIEDAEREDDVELADFFRRVRDEDSLRADEAQLLLAERTPVATETQGMATGIGATEGTVTAGGVEGRPEMGAAPTRTDAGGVGGTEPTISPTTESADTTSGRASDREEDKGLLDRAKEALTGEEKPGREEPPRRRP
jgi:hypothetical protein